MRNKWFVGFTMIVLVTSLIASTPQQSVAPVNASKSISDIAMFRTAKFSEHLRTPNEAQIENLLRDEQVISAGTGDVQIQAAVDEFKVLWAERNPQTPNPVKFQKLLEKERETLLAAAGEMQASSTEEADVEAELAEESTAEASAAAQPAIKSLVVPVEFPGTDTFDVSVADPNNSAACIDESVTTSGPLHNEIAPPGPRDNNSIYYDDTSPELYNELYFGVGPDAGVIVNHPNLGQVDLRGNTMANYYIEQSEGAFVPTGEVYPKWLQALHSEGWYGADSCATGSRYIRAHDLVLEVIDLVNADNPSFDWQTFDADADGFVDNFTVIHAGQGQEGGGGAQGTFAIWSHASMINWPSGYLACAAGSAGCPDRDIYVLEYSMDPENIDIGVIAEEFGHAAFGLPDIYVTDAQGSPSNWAIMEAGSWNGPLAGMQPAPFPLWFRYTVGWAKPVIRNYNSSPTSVVVGQLSKRPFNTRSGVLINLPTQQVSIPNPLGTGNAWWSDSANVVTNTLTRSFDLTSATAPVFSFASYWSIETEFDYGYVEVSTDGGATWVTLPDREGNFTTYDPNNANDGWGLTGEGQGGLSFDLAAYAGMQIQLRLRYTTDLAVKFNGWWADDFKLVDGATTLYTADLETDQGGWTADGWRMTPTTEEYPIYYLVEWRNNSGFDRGLAYPYQTVYNDEDEWEVDRSPYEVPGMLLWLRNSLYDFDYTLLDDALYDTPSIGPKHALLIVDSHSFPHPWNYTAASGMPLKVSGRVEPYDAAFTLQDIPEMTLRLGYDPYTGVYQDTIVDTKTFAAEPAVSQFHDSVGYYPGIAYSDITGGLYFWDTDSSLAVPAKAPYTTRITDLNNDPLYDLYGATVAGSVLGSGNPGDAAAQYGLHLGIIRQARDGSWGKIAIWNSKQVIDLSVRVNRSTVLPGAKLSYLLTVKNKTPVLQSMTVIDPLPEYTAYKGGPYFDEASNSFIWNVTLAPYASASIPITLVVSKDAPNGTLIANTAYVEDSAVGDTATASTTVIRPPWMGPTMFTEDSELIFIPFITEK
ncbi:MAG TPA: M6 family metalloprotease domain-containing protein [Anaerolineaceae bacterium]|nr:M6 family metalloprotease domain-containing protein [Anaerolineaceae bacterium]